MSEEQQVEVTSPSTPLAEAPLVDAVLALYLDLAETAGLKIGITLAIPGGLVTGTLVGGVEWLRAVAATLPADRVGQVLADGLEQLAKLREDSPRAPGDPGPWYVNLVDAQHVSGETFIPNPGKTLWRVRLSEVVGWTLGNTNRSQPMSDLFPEGA